MKQSTAQKTQQTFVILTLALGGGLLGTTGIALMMPRLEEVVIVVGFCAALLSALIGAVTLRKSRSPQSAVVIGALLTFGASVLNSPLSLAVSFLVMGSPERDGWGHLAATLFMGTVFGLAMTIPLGGLFALIYTPLLSIAQRHIRNRSRESVELTLRLCGGWLAVIGYAVAGASTLLYNQAYLPALLPLTLTALSLVLATIGGFAVLTAQFLLRARRRWVQRVLNDMAPGWAVVSPATIGMSTDGLERLFSERDDSGESVLVRRFESVPRGAYRSGVRFVPVALI